MVHPRQLWFLLVFMTFGCSAGEVERERPARVDTLASDRVVDNTGVPGWSSGTAWRFEEDLRLGTVAADDPEEFGTIMSVVADAEGMIYVLDAHNQRIQVFHPDGTFSHTIGRRGEGPGEFAAARALAIGPDETLWVVDDGMARYSAFRPDGTFLESHARRIQGFFSSGTFLPNGQYFDWGIAFPDGRQGPRIVLWPIQVGPHQEGPDSLPPLEHAIPGDQWLTLPFIGSLSVAVDREGAIWFANTKE